MACREWNTSQCENGGIHVLIKQVPRVGEGCLIRPLGYQWRLSPWEKSFAESSGCCHLLPNGRSLQRILFLPEYVCKWRSILLSVYLIIKSISSSVSNENGEGRKSEKGKERICLEERKLCTVHVSPSCLSLSSYNHIPWASWMPDKLRSYVSMGTA